MKHSQHRTFIYEKSLDEKSSRTVKVLERDCHRLQTVSPGNAMNASRSFRREYMKYLRTGCAVKGKSERGLFSQSEWNREAAFVSVEMRAFL